jgi:acetylornithine deacetylase/succinyl-diaminopimelate desuccinylase-like protein
LRDVSTFGAEDVVIGSGRPRGHEELAEVVRALVAWGRPSASPGERHAAEWIVERLHEVGVPNVRMETEAALGGYWWPLGLLSLASGAAALIGGRLTRRIVGALAALGIWDELGLHRGVWTRRFVRRRTTTNVIAEVGDRDAPRHVVVIAHHDAAHSGTIFNPTLTYAIGRRSPQVIERARSWPRIMGLVFAGPVLVAFGARRLGALLSLGSAAAFADIGHSQVVPGANDNLSGVAALIALARRLSETPPSGLRVLFVSAGAEESFEEGSQAFFRRHGAELPRERTYVIVLDTVGSPRLVLVEGEGMLQRTEYDVVLKDTIHAAARTAGIPIVREHWLSFGSDALAGLRAGYPSALVASFDELKLPSNYHWPTDVFANVDFNTVAQAVTVVEGALRLLAARA